VASSKGPDVTIFPTSTGVGKEKVVDVLLGVATDSGSGYNETIIANTTGVIVE
jgi:hypothetical protein